MEIERKFIADREFVEAYVKAFNIVGDKIEQYYVRVGEVEERFRHRNGVFYHTIKTGSGLTRTEHEEKISRFEFNRNLKNRIGNVIEKTRYVLPYEQYNIEVDIYGGELDGLSICEIEFESEQEAAKFYPTNLCLKEVTNDERFKNQNLAIDGLPDELEKIS